MDPFASGSPPSGIIRDDNISLSLGRLGSLAPSRNAAVEIAWHLFIYVPFVLVDDNIRKRLSGAKRVASQPRRLMAPHILLGLSLVCRYLYRTATAAGPPAPDAFDAAAGAANALLGWELCKRDSRGFPLILRGSFQVVSIMLFFAAGMTYQTQSPVWYHVMVKMHNAFAYVRWMIAGGLALEAFDNYGQAFSFAMVGASMLALWEADFPYSGLLGMPVYLSMLPLLALVEKQVSAFITPKNAEHNPLIRLVLHLGLVEVGTYRKLKEAKQAAIDGARKST